MDNRLLGLIETLQWQEAWTEFQRLHVTNPDSPRLLLMGSHVAFGQRDLFRARYLAELALKAWDESHPLVLLGKIRFHLGMVAREIGDTHVAYEQFQVFLSELPERYPELSMGEGKAYFYLALSLRQRRDLNGALSAYHSAIACFRRDNLPGHLCKGLQNQAWLLCSMHRLEEAREALAESAKLIQTSAEQVHQMLGDAYLAVEESRYSEAAVLCESIFRRADRGEPITTEERSQAAWIAATAALGQGNTEQANALANIALEYAAESRDSRLINDAGALRRVIENRRQPEQTA